MADLRKDPASDDYLLTSAAFTGKLGVALAGGGGGGELFVAQIGGTGSTHADVNAAIAAYNGGSETRAVIHIADVAADWGAVITISKPIKFVGIVENAGLSGSSPPNINFADTAQPLIEFENVGIFGSPGDQEFTISDSVIFKFTNCVVSSTKGSAVALFEMSPGAGGAGLMQIFAKDSFFQVEADTGTGVLFSNRKSGGDIEFHLEHSTFFNLQFGASAGLLAVTDNGGSIFVFAKDGTVLHRPGFATSGTGSKNLDVIYDGASLVTDFVSGGIGVANAIGGTTTVNGEAAYNTIMDVIDTDLSVQRALTEFMGSDLRLAAGTYVTTAAINVSSSNKTITGAGCENTFITSSQAGPVNFTVSGGANRIFGITVTPLTNVPGAIFELSGNANKLIECRARTPNVGVYTSTSLILASGDRNWIVDCMIQPDQVTIQAGVRLSGDFNFARGNIFRPLGAQAVSTPIAFDTGTTSTGNRVYENWVDLNVAYLVAAGIRVGGSATQVYSNYLYSGVGATYTRGIDTHGTPTECRIDDNHIENDAGVPVAAIELKAVTDSLVRGNAVYGAWTGSSVGLRSDASCDDNLYSHNHLLAIDTPGDRLIVNVSDNSASPNNVVS